VNACQQWILWPHISDLGFINFRVRYGNEPVPANRQGKRSWGAFAVARPLPDSEAYGNLPQFPKHRVLPFRRTIRRAELQQIVPLAETTIYEMERRGEFPRRVNLTARCVVWDLDEVQVWIEARKQAPRGGISKPNVCLRKSRPVRTGSSQT